MVTRERPSSGRLSLWCLEQAALDAIDKNIELSPRSRPTGPGASCQQITPRVITARSSNNPIQSSSSPFAFEPSCSLEKTLSPREIKGGSSRGLGGAMSVMPPFPSCRCGGVSDGYFGVDAVPVGNELALAQISTERQFSSVTTPPRCFTDIDQHAGEEQTRVAVATRAIGFTSPSAQSMGAGGRLTTACNHMIADAPSGPNHPSQEQKTADELEEAADAECWTRLHEQLQSLHQNVQEFANRCPPVAAPEIQLAEAHRGQSPRLFSQSGASYVCGQISPPIPAPATQTVVVLTPSVQSELDKSSRTPLPTGGILTYQTKQIPNNPAMMLHSHGTVPTFGGHAFPAAGSPIGAGLQVSIGRLDLVEGGLAQSFAPSVRSFSPAPAPTANVQASRCPSPAFPVCTERSRFVRMEPAAGASEPHRFAAQHLVVSRSNSSVRVASPIASSTQPPSSSPMHRVPPINVRPSMTTRPSSVGATSVPIYANVVAFGAPTRRRSPSPIAVDQFGRSSVGSARSAASAHTHRRLLPQNVRGPIASVHLGGASASPPVAMQTCAPFVRTCSPRRSCT